MSQNQSLELVAIRTASRRVRRFAESIQQGHDFGMKTGTEDEPWSLDFHRRAVEIYGQTLPWGYLLGLADGFEGCADLLVSIAVPIDDSQDCAKLQEFLRSASRSIRESPSRMMGPYQLKGAWEIEQRTPPVMPFEKLVPLVSREGVQALRRAARTVEALCSDPNAVPITELERVWLLRLSQGHRTIDIAADQGFSERSFYRSLSQLWKRLDVANRAEGIALAHKSGWLEEDLPTR